MSEKRGLQRGSRALALLLVLTMLTPFLVGCGGRGGGSQANLPPVDDTQGGTRRVEPAGQRQGMSTSKKVAILAGAAALYYLYKRSQDKKAAASEHQYYLSKNGRVYYRDDKGRAHWVTQAPAPMEVPMDELQRYPELSRYRGYNNQNSGEDFGNLLGAR